MDAASENNTQLAGFASYIVNQGLLAEENVKKAVEYSQKDKTPLIVYLVQQKLIDSEKIAQLAAEYFGLPMFDLNAYNPDIIPENLINKQLVNNQLISSRYALPLFKQDDQLYVAVTDPTIPDLNEIGFITGLNIRYVIVESYKLAKLIDKLASTHLSFVLNDLSHTDLTLNNELEEQKSNTLGDAQIDENAAPIVRFINEVLLDAIKKGASDIHFEPYYKKYRIRFRLDGLLYEVTAPPVDLVNYFVARLKVMANLDISEHRIPQDGRFKITLANDPIDFRVSICPMLHGEKIVLRILAQSNEKMLNIDNLGLEDSQKKLVQKAVDKPQGIILVTGPTGSGKTVTLYTALSILNKTDVNISSVEDPVEIELHGINQVPVNPAINLTFATALRSFLRQDPDIIMVGEIRDLETAEIAVKASQTGHLVLSTVHTNSAPETIVRLDNMGVAPFNISSTLSLIIAQRLIRKLCPHCKREVKIPKEVLLKEGFSENELKDLKLYSPGSCDNCMNGYLGRIGIYEVMPISDETKRMIMLGKGALDLAIQTKKEGIMNLRAAGIQKVISGITSLEEVNRVTTN